MEMTPDTSNHQGFNIRLVYYRHPFPVFTEPQVVGCYSLDKNRNFIDGPAHLKYCHSRFRQTKQVNYNLNAGLTTESIEELAIPYTQRRASENSELKHLRKWMNIHKDVFLLKRPNFVLRRGVLLKILQTRYEEREDWILAAMYKNGTVYLRKILKFTTEEWAEQNTDSRRKRFTSWGLNFEDFVLSDDPSQEPNPDNPRGGECNLVLRAKLNQREILYAAELDGIWWPDGRKNDTDLTPERLNKASFVELKTSRNARTTSYKDTSYFRNAITMKWWCQSYLGRVHEILVGLRTDGGVVRTLDILPVRELPNLTNKWSPSICFNFLDRFLTEVERLVNRSEETVYVLRFNPSNKNTEGIHIDVTPEKNSDKLLSDLL